MEHRIGKKTQPFDLTINNFMKWTKSMKKNRKSDNHETFTVKSKLALSAFVNSLIKSHKTELVRANGVACTNYTHNSLYIALRLCYELDLRSQKVVSELIREIFLCEGNLHAIFSIINESHVTMGFPRSGSLNIHSFTLYPRATLHNFSDIVIPALTYYVQNSVNLEKDMREKNTSHFNNKTRSFLTQPMGEGQTLSPLMAATMRKEPELVLMLLRFGADPTVAMDPDCDSLSVNPIQYIVTCLNSFTSIRSSSWLDKYHYSDNLMADGERCHKILELFQRSVHHIHLKVSSGMLGDNDNDLTYYLHPKLTTLAQNSATPTLQHLSRCAVRRHLAAVSCETIPDAIKCLPLPQLMKEFLDLKS